LKPVVISARAHDDRSSALRFVIRLRRSCLPPGRHPSRGGAVPAIAPGLRVSVLGSCLIPSRVLDDAVAIDRVVQGARDLATILDDG
jgi:plasmid stabilization system protein ParE